MTIWQREKRLPTVGEARDYFDAHAEDGGDPDTMEECERVLDATQHPADGQPGAWVRRREAASLSRASRRPNRRGRG